MANIAIVSPKLSDDATIEAVGSEDASRRVADKLQKMQPTSVWRATDLSASWFEVDLGGTETFDFVGLLYTNATESATWRVRAASTQADLTGSPGYDSGSINLWPTSGLDDWNRVHGQHFIGSDQSFQWVRIDVSDAGNPDDYFQSGRLYINDIIRPTQNINFGWNIRYKSDRARQVTVGRNIYPRFSPTNRAFEGVLDFQTESAAWDDLEPLFRLRGTGKDVFVQVDSGNSPRMQQWGLMGVFTRLEPITSKSMATNRFRVALSIEEML